MSNSLPIRIAMAVLALCIATAPTRADWPSSATVNLPVCTSPNLQSGHAIASDLAGGVFIAWNDLRNGVDTDVYAQHVLSTGVIDPVWPVHGVAITALLGAQNGPKIISDGSGGAYLAWQDFRTGSAATSDVYAQHLRSDGTVDPAWPANGLAVCTAAGQQASVNLLSDEAGGAIVAWRDLRNDTDLFAARVLSNGQLDPAWAVNGNPIVSGAGGQNNMVLAPDGHGGLIATWTDTRNGASADIYAQRLLQNGSIAPGWPVNGIAVCTAVGLQQIPDIAPDAAGGAFIGWEDYRPGLTADIYIHHLRANGTLDPTWPADGSLACAAGGNQTRASVAAGAAGGVFAAWIDARSGSIPALYAQHLLANGSLDPAWPVADLNFCAAFGNHSGLVVLPDGSGGALVVWDDRRDGGVADVYAHHLLSTGAADAAWPVNGRGVSVATGSQSGAGAVLADGSGGLIVAWTDSRTFTTSNNDIYAQRVQANGTLGGSVLDVPQGRVTGLELAPLAPTPARSDRLGLRYTLPRAGHVQLELLDVAGRMLAVHDLGIQSAGPHAFDWAPQTRVHAGLQFVRLRFGGDTRTVRAVIVE
ncbi:MAG: hypothetical protein ABL977_12195 [Candidatus Eisenbacteria bacterium]